MKRESENPNAEYQFDHSSQDAYAWVIVQRLSMPRSALRGQALESLKKIDKNTRVILEETRQVHGKDVLCLQLDWNLRGTGYSYYGYYWAGEEGTIQFVCATGQNLFDEFKKDFDDLLSGLQLSLSETEKIAETSQDMRLLNRVFSEANKMMVAILQNDFKTFAQHLPDFMLNEIGGLDQAQQMTAKMFGALKISETQVQVHESIQLVRDKNLCLAVVPTTAKAAMKGTPVFLEGYIVGISRDGGTSWRFIEGSSDIREFLPFRFETLSKHLVLPQRQQTFGSTDSGKPVMRLLEVNGEWVPDDATSNELKRVLGKGEARQRKEFDAFKRRFDEYDKDGSDQLITKLIDKTITEYTEAIRLNPTDALAYADRGVAYAKKQEFDKAIADYTEAIQINPRYPPAYANRGNVHSRKGAFTMAIADYTEAIRLNPRYALAYANRGIAYASSNAPQKAISDFTESIRLNPKHVDAYFNRGTMYAQTRAFDKAIADYTEAIRINPKHASAYVSRGIVFGQNRAFDKAIADFTEAISLNPRMGEAYYNRGRAHLEKGDRVKGQADFATAKQLGVQTE